MILLIDNYDSFVFNLDRYVRELGVDTRVVRNDELDLNDIPALAPRAIIISPGPCSPTEAGISVPLIRALGPSVPILGVCLGHQCIAAACGGRVVRSPQPMHGRSSLIDHDGQGLFQGLASPLQATRYHSLIVERIGLPATLQVTATTGEGLVMGLRHREWPLFGVQFHPESILTADGHRLLANFLHIAGLTTTAYRIAERPDSAADLDGRLPPAGTTPLTW